MLGGQRCDLFFRLLQCGFWIHGHAVGGEDLNVVGADETHYVPQVAGGEIDRAVDLCAAGCNRNDGAFPFQKTFWPCFGLAEGHAGPGHEVNPGFQGGGNAEVVNRNGDHDRVRRFQFGDQGILNRKRGLLRIGAGVGGREVRADPRLVNLGQGCCQIACGDMRVFKTIDDFVGQIA